MPRRRRARARARARARRRRRRSRPAQGSPGLGRRRRRGSRSGTRRQGHEGHRQPRASAPLQNHRSSRYHVPCRPEPGFGSVVPKGHAARGESSHSRPARRAYPRHASALPRLPLLLVLGALCGPGARPGPPCPIPRIDGSAFLHRPLLGPTLALGVVHTCAARAGRRSSAGAYGGHVASSASATAGDRARYHACPGLADVVAPRRRAPGTPAPCGAAASSAAGATARSVSSATALGTRPRPSPVASSGRGDRRRRLAHLRDRPCPRSCAGAPTTAASVGRGRLPCCGRPSSPASPRLTPSPSSDAVRLRASPALRVALGCRSAARRPRHRAPPAWPAPGRRPPAPAGRQRSPVRRRPRRPASVHRDGSEGQLGDGRRPSCGPPHRPATGSPAVARERAAPPVLDSRDAAADRRRLYDFACAPSALWGSPSPASRTATASLGDGARAARGRPASCPPDHRRASSSPSATHAYAAPGARTVRPAGVTTNLPRPASSPRPASLMATHGPRRYSAWPSARLHASAPRNDGGVPGAGVRRGTSTCQLGDGARVLRDVPTSVRATSASMPRAGGRRLHACALEHGGTVSVLGRRHLRPGWPAAACRPASRSTSTPVRCRCPLSTPAAATARAQWTGSPTSSTSRPCPHLRGATAVRSICWHALPRRRCRRSARSPAQSRSPSARPARAHRQRRDHC